MKKTKRMIAILIILIMMVAIMPLNMVLATELGHFNVTISELVSGQDLITNCSVDSDASYSARIVKWYKGGSLENPGIDLGLNGKYEAGNPYIVEVAFKPSNGNTISQFAEYDMIGAPKGYYVETNSDGEAIVRFELQTSYIVKFDTNGGSKVPDAVIPYNYSIAGAEKIPQNPVKDGYTFFGWYPDTNFYNWQKFNEGNFHQIFNKDITLYALFVENSKIINKININVASPIVGDKVTVKQVVDPEYGYGYEEINIRPEITILDENAPYQLSEARWVETGEDYFGAFIGTIEANKNYLADIIVYLPEDSDYRFSDSLTIIANGEEPLEIGDIATTYASFIVKVASATEKNNQVVPEQEKTNESEEEKVKPVEVKVEAVENTSTDTSAAEAVKQLVNNIVDGKEVSGISNELKTKISKALNEGKSISVEVTAPEVTEETVKEDAEKVKEKLSSDEKIATYFDIDVLVKIDGMSSGNVTELGDKITITVPVPANLPKVEDGYTRQFTVIRVHDGVAEELETSVSGDEITFSSDKFSTYAIAYKDVKNEKTTIKSNNPQTGDNVVIFAVIFVISAIGLIITVKLGKNRRIRKH